MLNQTKRLYKSKSKSKIFITILCIFGLLFSWSCSCKNRVSDPNETPINGGITNKKPDETPTGTFSMSAATDNVTDNFIVKSASTSGEIKIGFVSANNYAYTSSYEVVDNDTTETNRITTAETTYANNILTIKDTAVAKVRNLDSSGGPAEKTITINFTFKANDTSLKNNTQTLSVEVKLTKAQEVKDDKLQDFMQTILRRGDNPQKFISGPPSHRYEYKFNEGIFNTADNTFTVKNSNSDDVDGEKNWLRQYADYNVKEKNYNEPIGNIPEILESEFVSDDLATDGKSYTITYKITFANSYELGITEIKIKYEDISSKKIVDDTASGS